MRRICVILFILKICINVNAQSLQVESSVYDSDTKLPLSGAHIYTNGKIGTISNSVGNFSFCAPTGDAPINISYLGYEPLMIKANEIPSKVFLKPIAYDIKPAFILAIDKYKFVTDLYKRHKNLAKKSKKIMGYYFYRQTTMEYGKCNEIVEAILNASADFSLKIASVIKGRFAALPSDSSIVYTSYTNFYLFSQISYVNPYKTKKNQGIMPLSENSLDYYDIDIDLLSTENNNEIYVIHFTPKFESIKLIKSELYVNPDDLTVLRYCVELPYTTVDSHSKQESHGIAHYTMNLDNSQSVPTVLSITVSTTYENPNAKNKDDYISVTSLLVRMNQDIKIKGKKKLNGQNSLLREIYDMEDDAEFWRNNQIIKRTPLEESTLKMFEEKNLIGNYEIN